MMRSSLLSGWNLKFQALLVLLVCVSGTFAQQSSGTLRGRVSDEFGGLIVAATVTVADQNSVEKSELPTPKVTTHFHLCRPDAMPYMPLRPALPLSKTRKSK